MSLIKNDSVESLPIPKELGGFHQPVQTGLGLRKQCTNLNLGLHKCGWRRPSLAAEGLLYSHTSDLIKSHCLNQSVAATTQPLAKAVDPPKCMILFLVEAVLFCRENHGA